MREVFNSNRELPQNPAFNRDVPPHDFFRDPQPSRGPQTALTVLRQYLTAIPKDQVLAVDSDKRVKDAAHALSKGFLEYLLYAHPLGNEYCAGAGAELAENLLNASKAAHQDIVAGAQSRVQELERTVLEQAQVIERLEKQQRAANEFE